MELEKSAPPSLSVSEKLHMCNVGGERVTGWERRRGDSGGKGKRCRSLICDDLTPELGSAMRRDKTIRLATPETNGNMAVPLQGCCPYERIASHSQTFRREPPLEIETK